MPEGELFRPRRPWGRWVVLAVTVVVAVALLLYVLVGDGGDGNVAMESPSPAPEISASESPSPSPTSTPSPDPTTASPAPSPTSASPSPSASRTRRPRATTATSAPAPSCRTATRPARSVAPAPNLAIELILPTNAYRSGSPVVATVRVFNRGSGTVRFDATAGGTLLDSGRPVSAQRAEASSWSIPAGASQDRKVTVTTRSCTGPLAADRSYGIVVTLDEWSSPVRSVTLYA